MTCSYIRTVGTSYSESVSNAFAIDASIQATMEAGFFSFFHAEIGVSANTGYDWTHVSEDTKSQEATMSVCATQKIKNMNGINDNFEGHFISITKTNFTYLFLANFSFRLAIYYIIISLNLVL